MKYTNIFILPPGIFEKIVRTTNYKVTRMFLENTKYTIRLKKVGYQNHFGIEFGEEFEVPLVW